MKAILILLFAVSLNAAVTVTKTSDGSACSRPAGGSGATAGPCTHTLTIAATVASAGELTEFKNIQKDLSRSGTVLCGDKVVTPANKEYATTTAIDNYWRCTAENPIIIESEQISRIPANVRPTAAYEPLMTRIRFTAGSGGIAWQFHGTYNQGALVNTVPAGGIIKRGILVIGNNNTGGVPSSLVEYGYAPDDRFDPPELFTMIDYGDHLTYYIDPAEGPFLSPVEDACSLVGGVWTCNPSTRSTQYATDVWVKINGVDTFNTVSDDCVHIECIAARWTNRPEEPFQKTYYTNGVLTFKVARAPGDLVQITLRRSQMRLPSTWTHDITMDRCIVRLDRLSLFSGSPLVDANRMVRFKMLNTVVRQSKGYLAETKALGTTGGCNDCEVHNSELEASGINFIAGGAWADSLDMPSFIFRDNLLIKREWMRTSYWNNNTCYEIGQLIRPRADSTKANYWQVATNTGCTGATEPTWITTTCLPRNPSGSSQTTSGTITFACFLNTSSDPWQVKNTFESKMGDDWIVERNGLYNSWGDSQHCMITFKSESSWAKHSRTMYTRNILFQNNWMERFECPINMTSYNKQVLLPGAPAGFLPYEGFGPMKVHNNVFTRGSQRYIAAGSKTPSACTTYGAQIGNSSKFEHTFQHNLWDIYGWDGKATGASVGPPDVPFTPRNCTNYVLVIPDLDNRSNVAYNSNIQLKQPLSDRMIRADDTGAESQLTGAEGIRLRWQGTPDQTAPAVIPPNRFNKNLMVGIPLTGTYAYSVFPQAGGAHPGNETLREPTVDTIGALDWPNKRFQLTRTSTYKNAGHDGADVGPSDINAIPFLYGERGPGKADIRVSGRVAIITVARSGGASYYPAGILVSSTQDRLNSVDDLSPVTYNSPELAIMTDDRTAHFIVGIRNPLPNGQYWFEIHSGGGYVGPSTMPLAYEFDYPIPGATFTITGDAEAGFTTDSEKRGNCVATTTNTIPKGVPYYKRWHQSGGQFRIEIGSTINQTTRTINSGTFHGGACVSGPDGTGPIQLMLK